MIGNAAGDTIIMPAAAGLLTGAARAVERTAARSATEKNCVDGSLTKETAWTARGIEKGGAKKKTATLQFFMTPFFLIFFAR